MLEDFIKLTDYFILSMYNNKLQLRWRTAHQTMIPFVWLFMGLGLNLGLMLDLGLRVRVGFRVRVSEGDLWLTNKVDIKKKKNFLGDPSCPKLL